MSGFLGVFIPVSIYDNFAALSADNPGMLKLAQLKTNLSYYMFEPNSTLSTDGYNVIAPTSGSGKWVRQTYGHELWRNQSTWYIDPLSGSEENDGLTSSTPIKTFQELNRRLDGVINTTINITILNDITETSPKLNVRTAKPGIFVNVFGTRTTVRTSTLTSAGTNATPASNLAPSITDTSVVSWTSEVGKFVEITSGAQTGAICQILKDTGSGTARTTPWMIASGVSAAVTTPPDSGSAYRVYNITDSGNLSINMSELTGRTVRLNDLIVNMLGAPGLCRFCIMKAMPACTGPFSFHGCNIPFVSQAYSTSQNAQTTFSGCGFLNSLKIEVDSGVITASDCIFQKNGSINANVIVNGNGAAFNSFTRCGFFDITISAIQVPTFATLSLGTDGFYGSGNTSSLLAISSGGMVSIPGSYVPTATTSASTHITLDGFTSHLPPLEASAGGSLPALSAMLTFTAWSSSPFSGNVTRSATGSRLIR